MSSKNTSKHPKITAYIPLEVLDALRKEAAKNRRSMNSQLVWFLEQSMGMRSYSSDKIDKSVS